MLEKHFDMEKQVEQQTTTTLLPTTTTTSSSLTWGDEGILITGGNNTYLVELYLPNRKKFCKLPPTPRVLNHDRTLDIVLWNRVVCAPLLYGDTYSCMMFKASESGWVPYGNQVTKEDWKNKLRSWISPQGLMLIDQTTSQLVLENTKNNFAEGVRDFCAIPYGDSVILTGGHDQNEIKDNGYYSGRSVTRHRIGEKPEKLPYLNFARSFHGCGRYKHGGKKVLVVFGGRKGDNYEDVMTLEKYYYEPRVLNFDYWLRVDKLDMVRPIHIWASVSLGNKIYFIGIENYGTTEHLSAFNGDTEEWEEEVAVFETPRDSLTAMAYVRD